MKNRLYDAIIIKLTEMETFYNIKSMFTSEAGRK